MAKYVLIAFDNDNEADQFVAAFGVRGSVFYQDLEGHFQNVEPDKDFVRGLWKKPTLMCECPSGPKRNYVRSKQRGWYICTDCKKTHRDWAEGQHFYQSLGVNELPVSERAPEWRGQGKARHRFDEGIQNWVHVVTGQPFNAQRAFRERKDYTK